MNENANMTENTNMNEKGKGNAIIIIFMVLAGVAYLITERMIVSFLLAAVLTGVIAGLYYTVRSAINNKSSENKKGNFKKVVIWMIVLLSVVAVFVSFIITGANNKSPKCVNCGRNAIYSESGWCYSCYKEAENAVIDAYDKY